MGYTLQSGGVTNLEGHARTGVHIAELSVLALCLSARTHCSTLTVRHSSKRGKELDPRDIVWPSACLLFIVKVNECSLVYSYDI